MKEAGEAEGFHSAILERFVRLHSLFYYRLLDWIVCIIRGHSAFIFRVGQVFQYARKNGRTVVISIVICLVSYGVWYLLVHNVDDYYIFYPFTLFM